MKWGHVVFAVLLIVALDYIAFDLWLRFGSICVALDNEHMRCVATIERPLP